MKLARLIFLSVIMAACILCSESSVISPVFAPEFGKCVKISGSILRVEATGEVKGGGASDTSIRVSSPGGALDGKGVRAAGYTKDIEEKLRLLSSSNDSKVREMIGYEIIEWGGNPHGILDFPEIDPDLIVGDMDWHAVSVFIVLHISE